MDLNSSAISGDLLSYLLDQSLYPAQSDPTTEFYRQLLADMVVTGNNPTTTTADMVAASPVHQRSPSFMYDNYGVGSTASSSMATSPISPVMPIDPATFSMVAANGAFFCPQSMTSPTLATNPMGSSNGSGATVMTTDLLVPPPTSAPGMSVNINSALASSHPQSNGSSPAMANAKPSATGSHVAQKSSISSQSSCSSGSSISHSAPTSASSTANPSSSSSLNLKRSSECFDDPEEIDLKQLSSKERRQIRNKISARNFRLRRKEYITTLESQVQDLQDHSDKLQSDLDAAQAETQQLREQLRRMAQVVDPQTLSQLGPEGALALDLEASGNCGAAATMALPKSGLSSRKSSTSVTTVLSLLNLSTLLQNEKLGADMPAGVPHLTHHAKMVPTTGSNSVTGGSFPKTLTDKAANTSTPPTPYASPILSSMSTPATLVGDDELFLSPLPTSTAAALPMFSNSTTGATNSPMNYSSSPLLSPLQQHHHHQQLPKSQAELENLEHMLENQFCRVLTVSLNRLAQQH
ncbi:hypothetical protein H4R33_004331 [Dimargaris cristalligena]|uniref:BZIP domain-containing protein n=1 Tax=Dimargaris cristalligena TaxID=215637 RepID=A0A4Q0A211_9FUNG|nr:hypothetical protein H4R33_004331 [Dimargaris cristalligena]RKP39848.1 hypothetical protein BJ085DRAFT_34606 [Dimargaris cristalligena]|eukprot:RKP39848.1 hypothetical protein BJ085DRAFT_34606 [Dimargaris cristalligena]